MAKLTDAAIEAVKRETQYTDEPYHEHSDSIRIAYEWFDAQQVIKGKMRRHYPIKHIIESWAGRYVSQADVEVAATMHPNITGEYPTFNLSARLTRPDRSRLAGIPEAMTQENYLRQNSWYDPYKRVEQLQGIRE